MNYRKFLKRYKNLKRARDIISGEQGIALRHDIDSFNNMEYVVKIEKELGIKSSWYIIIDPSYKYYPKKRDFFLRLQDDGYEIGLHVNSVEISHTPWKGRSKEEAYKKLKEDIKIFKKDFDLKTLCGHGIKWKYTNKDLLKDYKIKGAFNNFFSDKDCIYSDSGKFIHIGESKRGYIIVHPENVFKRKETRKMESLTDIQLV